MDHQTREQVRYRADYRCEYCLFRQAYSDFTHHIEHIIPRRHKGDDSLDNLVLACHRCNYAKGPNIAGLDPLTNDMTRLFHPRVDIWKEHFVFDEIRVEGLTAVGRTTVDLLCMNDARRLELRKELAARGKLF